MGCRNNLKKEKRLRNRVNAFRFKKGGECELDLMTWMEAASSQGATLMITPAAPPAGPSRFQNSFQDRGAAKLKDAEDADWNALVQSPLAPAVSRAYNPLSSAARVCCTPGLHLFGERGS